MPEQGRVPEELVMLGWLRQHERAVFSKQVEGLQQRWDTVSSDPVEESQEEGDAREESNVFEYL